MEIKFKYVDQIKEKEREIVINEENSDIEDLSNIEFEIAKTILNGGECENAKLVKRRLGHSDYYESTNSCFTFAYVENEKLNYFHLTVESNFLMYISDNDLPPKSRPKRFKKLSEFEKEIVLKFFSDDKDDSSIVFDRYELSEISYFKFAYVKDNKLHTFMYEV